MSKLIDLTGKRFGKLIVKKRAGSDSFKKSTWLCDCDCGKKDIIITGRCLTEGISTSCKYCQLEDLTGKIFGRLTVTKNIGNSTYECKCECGNYKNIKRANLVHKTHGIKSCGCLRKEPAENLVGQKFNNLLVLKRVGTNSHRNPIYLCRCNCGKEKEILAKSFKYGHTKSCGCLKPRRGRTTYKNTSDALVACILSDYKRNAEGRGIEFMLDKNEFEKLINSNCFYCGSPLSNIKKNNGNEYPYNGVDRIDSTKGYIIENTVTCCRLCNSFKMKLNTTEFLNHVEKIYNYNSKENKNANESSLYICG